MIKANFKISKELINEDKKIQTHNPNEVGNVTKEDFEDFIIKSGAAGSFMVFRSNNKNEELGIDQL